MDVCRELAFVKAQMIINQAVSSLCFINPISPFF
jgi:hypothetical protein